MGTSMSLIKYKISCKTLFRLRYEQRWWRSCRKKATLSGGRDSRHQSLGSKHLRISHCYGHYYFSAQFSHLGSYMLLTRFNFCLAFCLALVSRVLLCTYADPGLLCLYISVHFAMSVRLVLRFAQRCGWGFRASGPTCHFNQKSDPDVARRRNANRSYKNSSK
jgi:hypothetical protein